MRPVTAMPSSGTSISVKPGRSISGTRNERPSSPPVMSESCAARMAKAEATASVTMAKKMARTRSENRPIRKASAMPATSAMARPASAAVQVAPQP